MFSSYSLLPKKWSLFKMFIKSALYLTKRHITGKQKQLSSKANVFPFYFNYFFFRYYDAYAACKVRIWYVIPFFKKQTNKQTTNYQKIGYPLKPNDVIVMPSNVHEWKGKPRFIVWCNSSVKRKLHPIIVSNIVTSKRFLLYHIDLQLTLYVVAFKRLSSPL